MSNTLWSHGLQHARLPCPSPSPRVCSNSGSLSQWWNPTNWFSVTPFSCPQSFPKSGYFPMSQLFTSGGQSIEASASASRNIQGWFCLPYSWLARFPNKVVFLASTPHLSDLLPCRAVCRDSLELVTLLPVKLGSQVCISTLTVIPYLWFSEWFSPKSAIFWFLPNSLPRYNNLCQISPWIVAQVGKSFLSLPLGWPFWIPTDVAAEPCSEQTTNLPLWSGHPNLFTNEHIQTFVYIFLNLANKLFILDAEQTSKVINCRNVIKHPQNYIKTHWVNMTFSLKERNRHWRAEYGILKLLNIRLKIFIFIFFLPLFLRWRKLFFFQAISSVEFAWQPEQF